LFVTCLLAAMLILPSIAGKPYPPDLSETPEMPGVWLGRDP